MDICTTRRFKDCKVKRDGTVTTCCVCSNKCCCCIVICIGVSINTKDMSDAERETYLKRVEDELGLPTVDPVTTGVSKLVDNLPVTNS